MKDKRFVFIVFAIIAIVVLGLVVLFSDNVIFLSSAYRSYGKGALYHPKAGNTYITSVGSVVSTIGNSDPDALGGERIVYDPPICGQDISVVCHLNSEISSNQAKEMNLYIFPANSSGILLLENSAMNLKATDCDGCNVIFRGYLTSKVTAGEYTFVILDDHNKVDSVFTYSIVATEQNSRRVGSIMTPGIAKPVIYMYPETDTEVNVSLDLNGEFTCAYPSYNDDYGWHVMAHPGGVITDLEGGRDYDYLYWEGVTDESFSFDQAVCVRGCDTAAFLEEYLEASGLTYSEIDDFITYWLPKMECNEYNLISFPVSEYEEIAELNVEPEPDTVIRVFMIFTPLDEERYIPEEQQLQMPTPAERKGFTVVEWGGSEV